MISFFRELSSTFMEHMIKQSSWKTSKFNSFRSQKELNNALPLDSYSSWDHIELTWLSSMWSEYFKLVDIKRAKRKKGLRLWAMHSYNLVLD